MNAAKQQLTVVVVNLSEDEARQIIRACEPMTATDGATLLRLRDLLKEVVYK